MNSKWPARIALMVSVVMLGAVMTTWQALGGTFAPLGMQTGSASASASRSGSASASPSVTCIGPQNPQNPTCRTVSPSGSSSGSGSPSGTATPSGGPGGENEAHDSNVTIKRTTRGFSGLVKSVGKCEPKREVVLRKLRKGADPVVGRDTTTAKGAWSVAVPNAKGRYYAKVLKRVFTQNDAQITCRGDRSRTVRA